MPRRDDLALRFGASGSGPQPISQPTTRSLEVYFRMAMTGVAQG
jgi:hypothetical protein